MLRRKWIGTLMVNLDCYCIVCKYLFDKNWPFSVSNFSGRSSDPAYRQLFPLTSQLASHSTFTVISSTNVQMWQWLMVWFGQFADKSRGVAHVSFGFCAHWGPWLSRVKIAYNNYLVGVRKWFEHTCIMLLKMYSFKLNFTSCKLPKQFFC